MIKTQKLAVLVSGSTTKKGNYKNNSYIMKSQYIRLKWEEFTRRYPKLFSLFEEKWEEKLKMVDEYIQTYNKLPDKRDKDTEVGSLGNWVSLQKHNYKKNLWMMKEEQMRIKWEKLIQKYPNIFFNIIQRKMGGKIRDG